MPPTPPPSGSPAPAVGQFQARAVAGGIRFEGPFIAPARLLQLPSPDVQHAQIHPGPGAAGVSLKSLFEGLPSLIVAARLGQQHAQIEG